MRVAKLIVTSAVIIAVVFGMSHAFARGDDQKEILKNRIQEKVEERVKDEIKRLHEKFKKQMEEMMLEIERLREKLSNEISEIVERELTGARRAAKPPKEKKPEAPVTPEEKKQPGALGVRIGETEEGEGVLVLEVLDGLPADQVGIEDGDVIIRFDRKRVNDVEELVQMISAKGAGEEATVTVIRDGKKKQFKVRLAARPEMQEYHEQQTAIEAELPCKEKRKACKRCEKERPCSREIQGRVKKFLEKVRERTTDPAEVEKEFPHMSPEELRERIKKFMDRVNKEHPPKPGKKGEGEAHEIYEIPEFPDVESIKEELVKRLDSLEDFIEKLMREKKIQDWIGGFLQSEEGKKIKDTIRKILRRLREFRGDDETGREIRRHAREGDTEDVTEGIFGEEGPEEVMAPRRVLGIRAGEVTEEMRVHLDLPEGGVVVSEIIPNTPAARSNLRVHDVIIKFDGVDVKDLEHLRALITESTKDKVTILILREGKRKKVKVDFRPPGKSKVDEPCEEGSRKVREQLPDVKAPVQKRVAQEGEGNFDPGEVLKKLGGENLLEIARVVYENPMVKDFVDKQLDKDYSLVIKNADGKKLFERKFNGKHVMEFFGKHLPWLKEQVEKISKLLPGKGGKICPECRRKWRESEERRSWKRGESRWEREGGVGVMVGERCPCEREWEKREGGVGVMVGERCPCEREWERGREWFEDEIPGREKPNRIMRLEEMPFDRFRDVRWRGMCPKNCGQVQFVFVLCLCGCAEEQPDISPREMWRFRKILQDCPCEYYDVCPPEDGAKKPREKKIKRCCPN